MLNRLALPIILVVAACLRLGYPDLTWFMIDQARDVTIARGIVQGRSFPLIGPEIAGGIAHLWGPLYFYLLAVPLAVSPNPALAAAFLSGLNLIAVYLTYRLGLTFFGREVGLIAAALFATYPGAVSDGRGLWNLPPLPLFTVLFFLCLYGLVIHQQSSLIVPALAAMACLTQFHLSTVSFFVVLVLALLLYRPPLRASQVALGLLVMLGLYFPYGAAQIMAPPPDALNLFAEVRAHAALPPRSVPWLVAQVSMAPTELGTRIAREVGPPIFARWFRVTTTAEVALIGLGGVYAAFRVLLSRDRAAGLLLLWMGTPFVVLSLLSRRFTFYYFDLLYPAPFLAMAALLAAVPRVWPSRAMILRVAVVVMVLVIMVTQAAFFGLWWVFAARTGTFPVPPVLELGVPVVEAPILPQMSMRVRTRLAAALVETLGPEPSALLTRAHGATIADFLEDKGYFFAWLSGGRMRRDGLHTHVTVLREGRGVFRVVEYTPRIDYQSWAYAHAPGGPWIGVRLPTRGSPNRTVYGYPPLFDWGSGSVFLRGTIDVPETVPSQRIVVALRGAFGAGQTFRVDDFMINDRLRLPDRVTSYGSLVGWNYEAVYALTPVVTPGAQVVSFRVTSQGPFDLDVYEIPADDGEGSRSMLTSPFR